MDIAWVPGGDPASLLAKELYADRVDAATSLDTKLVKVKKNRLADLITSVDADGSIAKPLASLILVSHGNDTGWLQIDLDSAPDTSITYQVLRKILDATDPSRRTGLRIPSSLYTNADGTKAATRVVLAGCRVGAAPKFVDAFKQVLGGNVPVVASKYLHEFVARTHRARGRRAVTKLLGTFEHLSYGFSTTAFLPMDVDTLIDGLNDYPKNRFSDGSAVPFARWATWLKGVPLDRKGNVRQGEFRLPLAVPLGQTVAGATELTPAKIRNLPTHYIVHLAPSAANKTLTGLKAVMQADPTCQTTYPFPMWEQYGHTTFDAFFDSWNWGKPVPGKTKDGQDQLVWTGVRNEYTLLIPVTSPVDGGNLIFNFFPPRGSTADSAVIGINETDPALFYRTA